MYPPSQTSHPHARGKLLGGSSGINGLAWGRAAATEYDAWVTYQVGTGDDAWPVHALVARLLLRGRSARH